MKIDTPGKSLSNLSQNNTTGNFRLVKTKRKKSGF